MLLTYFYLHSDTIENTHFLRPGIDIKLDLEIPVTKNFLISFGWASAFYIPQKPGNSPFEWENVEPDTLDQFVWHLGQAFFKFHFRFPVTVNL